MFYLLIWCNKKPMTQKLWLEKYKIKYIHYSYYFNTNHHIHIKQTLMLQTFCLDCYESRLTIGFD